MKRYFFVGLFGLLACSASSAQSTGFYAGASYLDTETEWRGESDDDSGFEARLGYTLDQNFSLELAYVDLGTVKLPEISDAGGAADTDGFSFSALGSYPIGSFNLIGKLGYLWAETDGYLGSIAGPIKFDSDENGLLLGVGLSYDLSESFDVRLEYNDSDDFNWISIGLNFHF
jgi:opacity protein-like surface antigen